MRTNNQPINKFKEDFSKLFKIELSPFVKKKKKKLSEYFTEIVYSRTCFGNYNFLMIIIIFTSNCKFLKGCLM